MTKSLILLLAYTFIPALVLAGTRTDTVVLKVKYAATFKTTMEDKATSKDEKTEFWKDQAGFITRKVLGMNIESFKSETGLIPCFIEYY